MNLSGGLKLHDVCSSTIKIYLEEKMQYLHGGLEPVSKTHCLEAVRNKAFNSN